MDINKKTIIGAIIAGAAIFTIVLVFAFAQPSYKPELPEAMPPSVLLGENYNHPYTNLPETTPPLAPGEEEVEGETERPTNPDISRDEAVEIAYEYLKGRGISATFKEDSGMDWKRGRWVWELEFRDDENNEIVYEFYIDVSTGYIVKFEREDDR